MSGAQVFLETPQNSCVLMRSIKRYGAPGFHQKKPSILVVVKWKSGNPLLAWVRNPPWSFFIFYFFNYNKYLVINFKDIMGEVPGSRFHVVPSDLHKSRKNKIICFLENASELFLMWNLEPGTWPEPKKGEHLLINYTGIIWHHTCCHREAAY